FKGIVQKMPAVEHGNGENVDEAEIDGEKRHEPHKAHGPVLGALGRKLRDSERPAQLLARPLAFEDLPQELEAEAQDMSRLGGGVPDGGDGIALHEVLRGARDAKAADDLRL